MQTTLPPPAMQFIKIPGPTNSRSENRLFYFPDIDDYLVDEMKKTNQLYEHDLLEHLARTGKQGGLYIDVGANIGVHSVFFATCLADSVLCVEPNPNAYALLQGTLDKNAVKNSLSKLVALGRTDGTGDVSIPHDSPGNLGAAQVVNAPGGSTRIVTLDGLLSSEFNGDAPVVTGIKIDVEDAEEEVLAGAAKTIEANRPDLIIEIRCRDRLRRIAKELEPLGYRVIGRFANTPTFHFAKWPRWKFVALRLIQKLTGRSAY